MVIALVCIFWFGGTFVLTMEYKRRENNTEKKNRKKRMKKEN